MDDYLTVAEAHRLIADYIIAYPNATYRELSTRFGYSIPSISAIARKMGLPSRAPDQRKSRISKASVTETE
jgi:DNA-binding MurR/RpiR family transcriptional regulator